MSDMDSLDRIREAKQDWIGAKTGETSGKEAGAQGINFRGRALNAEVERLLHTPLMSNSWII